MRREDLPEGLRDLFFYELREADQIGPWSRAMRQVTGVSASDVAEVLGVRKQQVCALERGGHNPSLRKAIEVIEAHGCRLLVVRKGIDVG